MDKGLEWEDALYCAVGNKVKRVFKGKWKTIATLPANIRELAVFEDGLYIAVDGKAVAV